MIILYASPSSYSTYDMCPLKWFYESSLKWRGPSIKKADKGTIIHAALETLADIQLAEKQNLPVVSDEVVGEISRGEFYTSDELILDRCYDHYTKLYTHHEWTDADRKECHKWFKKTIEYNNGMFDPRNLNVVSPEMKFDIKIEKDWAKYSYKIRGEKVEGHLGMRGIIDLVVDNGDGVYEIIDWKTGQRVNFATGERKTHEKLQDDFQLRAYHYAINKLFPEVTHVMVTIFYINDGGPFTMHFSKDDLLKTEKMLHERFDEIKLTKIPRDISGDKAQSWKCSKFCHAGMTTFEDTNIKPIVEFRRGERCRQGTTMTRCEQLKFEIRKKGIERVTDEYININVEERK